MPGSSSIEVYVEVGVEVEVEVGVWVEVEVWVGVEVEFEVEVKGLHSVKILLVGGKIIP